GESFRQLAALPRRTDHVAETRPARRAQFPPHRYSKRRRRSLQPPGGRQEVFRSGQTVVPRPDADIQVSQRGAAAKMTQPADRDGLLRPSFSIIPHRQPVASSSVIDFKILQEALVETK